MFARSVNALKLLKRKNNSHTKKMTDVNQTSVQNISATVNATKESDKADEDDKQRSDSFFKGVLIERQDTVENGSKRSSQSAQTFQMYVLGEKLRFLLVICLIC